MRKESMQSWAYIPRALAGRIHFEDPAGGGTGDAAAQAAADQASAGQAAAALSAAADKASADKAAADKAAADAARLSDDQFERYMRNLEKDPDSKKRALDRLAGRDTSGVLDRVQQ